MKLKGIATISSGYPFRGKIPEFSNSSIHVIQMKDICVDKGLSWNTTIKTTLSGKTSPKWLKPNDILFAARGSHNYAILVDDTALQIQAVAAPHFFVITCSNKQISPHYLAWLLNQSSCQRYYLREAEGSCTKSIRRSVLENTPIVVPSLPKQHAIMQLANALKQEQQMAKLLIRNSQKLMHRIATHLLQEPIKGLTT